MRTAHQYRSKQCESAPGVAASDASGHVRNHVRPRGTLVAAKPPFLALARVALALMAAFLVSNATRAEPASPPASAGRPKATVAKKPSFPGAKKVELKPQTVKSNENRIRLHVELELPPDTKLNQLAPMGYYLETVPASGPVDRSTPSKYQTVKPPKTRFDLLVPANGNGDDRLRLSMNYYYCKGDPETGVCKVGSVIWEIPIRIDPGADESQVLIKYEVPEI